MYIKRYLIIGHRPRQYSTRASARLTTKKPKLDAHEIAVQLNIDIPDSVFEKPSLQVNISAPDTLPRTPIIDMETVDNITELMAEQLGVRVEVVPPPNEETAS